MRKLLATLSFCLILFSGCLFEPEPTPTPVDPADAHTCGSACKHLRALGCEEGQPLSNGTTCEVFCEETQASGHALRPSCVDDIKVCSEIDSCSLPR